MTDNEIVEDKNLTAMDLRRKAAGKLLNAFNQLRETDILMTGNILSGEQTELRQFLLDTQRSIACQLENIAMVDGATITIFEDADNLYAPNLDVINMYISGELNLDIPSLL
ncbi:MULTISPECIES: hypothetical protein [unclassified Anabaena]|uniref:hypothetical protein n=1 Tax=unclassified Anabaena TaxID=2619674 RepID=UPI0006AC6095|nr:MULTISPECIES: hypothetical protein [unclassified Anabaena]ALB39898.1 hypothetical protein AA650_04950 [Anabaena sp. WA102]OBQ17639.1 MAG: hypothetical protein AN486_14560 [Anabaena sp. AL93]